MDGFEETDFEIDGEKFRAKPNYYIFAQRPIPVKVVKVYANGMECDAFDLPPGPFSERDIRVALFVQKHGHKAGVEDGKRDLQIALKKLLKLEGY